MNKTYNKLKRMPKSKLLMIFCKLRPLDEVGLKLWGLYTKDMLIMEIFKAFREDLDKR